jgi:hypothetical protein
MDIEELKQIEELNKIEELKKEDINFHISIIKMSLLTIKSLCKNQQEAYLYWNRWESKF